MKMRTISVLGGTVEGISSDSAGVLILYHFQELMLSFAMLDMLQVRGKLLYEHSKIPVSDFCDTCLSFERLHKQIGCLHIVFFWCWSSALNIGSFKI